MGVTSSIKVGLPSIACSIVSTNERQDGKRCSGSLFKTFRRTFSMSGVRFGLIDDGSGGGSVMCMTATVMADGLSKGT